jgi:hypothetical protein
MIPETLLSLRMTLRGPMSALPSSAAPDERVPCEGSGGDASAPRGHPRARCVPGLAHDVLHTLEHRMSGAVLPCGRVRGCLRAHRILARAEVQLAMRVRMVWVGNLTPRHVHADRRVRWKCVQIA